MLFEQTQEDSLTDPLTGLPNTRFLFMHLTRELARAERLKAEVSLMVMDLDSFKEINDNHGHHVGDRALCEVARVLRAAIRPYDICVRYAGDEFIVVLSGCGADEAEHKRQELQKSIDDVYFEARPGRECSSGSASARPCSRRTANRTKRCSPRPTAACIRTRPTRSGARPRRSAAAGAVPAPSELRNSGRPGAEFSSYAVLEPDPSGFDPECLQHRTAHQPPSRRSADETQCRGVSSRRARCAAAMRPRSPRHPRPHSRVAASASRIPLVRAIAPELRQVGEIVRRARAVRAASGAHRSRTARRGGSSIASARYRCRRQ